VKSAESGSTPSRAKRSPSPASSIRKASPKPALGGVERVAVVDQDQVAGHPQVHDQGLRPVERQQQVLAAPPQSLDLPARDGRLQLGRRHRATPALVVDLEPLDPPPFDLGLELAADGLDLGQLGHRPVLSAAWFLDYEMRAKGTTRGLNLLPRAGAP
jgi:hypothetical protein